MAGLTICYSLNFDLAGRFVDETYRILSNYHPEQALQQVPNLIDLRMHPELFCIYAKYYC